METPLMCFKNVHKIKENENLNWKKNIHKSKNVGELTNLITKRINMN